MEPYRRPLQLSWISISFSNHSEELETGLRAKSTRSSDCQIMPLWQSRHLKNLLTFPPLGGKARYKICYHRSRSRESLGCWRSWGTGGCVGSKGCMKLTILCIWCRSITLLHWAGSWWGLRLSAEVACWGWWGKCWKLWSICILREYSIGI